MSQYSYNNIIVIIIVIIIIYIIIIIIIIIINIIVLKFLSDRFVHPCTLSSLYLFYHRLRLQWCQNFQSN